MPTATFAALFLTISLGIITFATLGYLFNGRSREARFALVVSLLLIVALFAFSPLVFIARSPKARALFEEKARAYQAHTRTPDQSQEPVSSVGDTAPRDVVHQWTQVYGKDAVQVSFLTTDRFRKGKSRREWAERTHRLLEAIGYAHLGGEVEKELITGESAMVVLKARIAAVDGVSLQTEVYTLQRVKGRWLIDALQVKDEAVPGGKMRHGI